MFSFLSGISWTYYLIAGLVIALLASGYLLKNSIAETGALTAQNDALSAQLITANKDKENLSATLASTTKHSLEDEKERQQLQSKVVVLNKKITTLSRLTKEAPKDASLKNPDDVYLSTDLVRLLSESYCQSISGLCPNPDQPVK
jgi:hypothetical protein